MRLRKIYNTLIELIPDIELNGAVRNSSPRTYHLNNALELQEIVEELGNLGVFNERIEALKKLSFNNVTSNSIIIQDSEYRVLLKQIPELKNIANALAISIEHAISENNPDLISVKIPAPYNFEELEETANKLNKIFGQTLLNDDINGSIQITNFDTGTYWIDFLVGGATVVNVVGGIAWSAAVVYKKLQEGRLIQEQVKAMKISNTAFKEILEKSTESVNEVAEIEANYIYKAFYKGKDKEQIARIKMALKELAELYSKGAEIYPSIEAAEKVIDNFPDFKQIENIETKVRKIGNNK